MKFIRSALRLSSSLPKLPFSFSIPKPHLTPVTAFTSSLGFAYGIWYSSQKIVSEEIGQFETTDDLNEGEMREIQVGPKPEDTVLLVKYMGEYYCIQSKCPHFGYPMVKGVLSGDKVICPLHNAGFSIKSGYPEQGPTLDGLKTFPVEVENGKVRVSVPKVGWESKRERPPIG
jgi:nitrite reductase/ring-hydroxylating ferredoxin subunit